MITVSEQPYISGTSLCFPPSVPFLTLLLPLWPPCFHICRLLLPLSSVSFFQVCSYWPISSLRFQVGCLLLPGVFSNHQSTSALVQFLCILALIAIGNWFMIYLFIICLFSLGYGMHGTGTLSESFPLDPCLKHSRHSVNKRLSEWLTLEETFSASTWYRGCFFLGKNQGGCKKWLLSLQFIAGRWLKQRNCEEHIYILKDSSIPRFKYTCTRVY